MRIKLIVSLKTIQNQLLKQTQTRGFVFELTCQSVSKNLVFSHHYGIKFRIINQTIRINISFFNDVSYFLLGNSFAHESKHDCQFATIYEAITVLRYGRKNGFVLYFWNMLKFLLWDGLVQDY